jgi:UDP-2,4-diacetamido-2,4,6-trideoxy-beta-L-altropyranose hydrolase
MQIAFRVDASATIGTGHIMRCLTLADALKKRGAACTFISRHLPSYLQDIIESRGHQTIRIDKYGTKHPGDELPHAHFLGTSQSQDAADSQLTLESLQPNWLIIDHYGIDQRWESALRPFAKKILVIDDLADRSHDCDLLVDQNLYEDMASRYSGLLPTTAKALLGTKYAMLRPEFSDARKLTKPREGAIRRLFIFFGGMDSANFTLPILDALVGLKLRDIAVDVVIGSEHPIREKVERVCQEHVFGCHVQTKRMAKLLLKADAAIGAGGSTSWERCCLGLPSLAFIVAPNQKALTLHANHLGLLKAATADIQDAEELSNELQLFLDADEARGRMSRECLAAVDAHGANRIVDQMLATRPQRSVRIRACSSNGGIIRVFAKFQPSPSRSHGHRMKNGLTAF